MPSATTIVVVQTILSIVVAGLWVLGYLDGLQKTAQNLLLDKMGDNRASYGLKNTLKGQRLTEDKDVNDAQDSVADTAGGLLGKGGLGIKSFEVASGAVLWSSYFQHLEAVKEVEDMKRNA